MKLEVWRSTMNHEERHYFLANKGRGYQRHQYVFGYNPRVIGKRAAKRMREIALQEVKRRPT